jgi:uncharacterized cupin superfamily protein
MTEEKPAKITVLDAASVEPIYGTPYPEPYDREPAAREKRPLGDAVGLRNFGVNMTRLRPGVWSAQRHWHTRQDELIYIVSGEVTLVTDAGEEVLTAGQIAGFPAGNADGHCLINRGNADAVYLEIGDRMPGDEVRYPDIDLLRRDDAGTKSFTNKSGRPY